MQLGRRFFLIVKTNPFILDILWVCWSYARAFFTPWHYHLFGCLNSPCPGENETSCCGETFSRYVYRERISCWGFPGQKFQLCITLVSNFLQDWSCTLIAQHSFLVLVKLILDEPNTNPSTLKHTPCHLIQLGSHSHLFHILNL